MIRGVPVLLMVKKSPFSSILLKWGFSLLRKKERKRGEEHAVTRSE